MYIPGGEFLCLMLHADWSWSRMLRLWQSVIIAFCILCWECMLRMTRQSEANLYRSLWWPTLPLYKSTRQTRNEIMFGVKAILPLESVVASSEEERTRHVWWLRGNLKEGVCEQHTSLRGSSCKEYLVPIISLELESWWRGGVESEANCVTLWAVTLRWTGQLVT